MSHNDFLQSPKGMEYKIKKYMNSQQQLKYEQEHTCKLCRGKKEWYMMNKNRECYVCLMISDPDLNNQKINNFINSLRN